MFALCGFIRYPSPMNRKAVFLIFISVLSGLNLGTVRQAEDPIRDTQTNPILYEQKKEEEKDGVKGPLLYHVNNYPRETFFIDPPYEADKKNSAKETSTEEAPVPAGISGWWEEQPTTPQTASPAGTVAEPLRESLPKEQQDRDHGVPDQTAASAPDAKHDSEGKGTDYWW
jgi:hypothetical protein